jgi:hypothetical protein
MSSRPAPHRTLSAAPSPAADPALDEALERISDLAARLWAVRSAHRPVTVGWRRTHTQLRRLRAARPVRDAAGRRIDAQRPVGEGRAADLHERADALLDALEAVPTMAPPRTRATMPAQTTASLKAANAAYQGSGREVETGARGVALGDLGPRREALEHRRRRHDERVGAGARVVGLRPVAEQDADVGERVAERRHLPVEDGRDPPGRRRVEDRVVEAVVAVHDGVPLRRRDVGGEVGREGVERLVALDAGRVPLLHPAAHLPLEVALGPAELAQPDRDGVDVVQRGEHVDEPLADRPALRGLVGVARRQVGPADVPLDALHDVERLAEHLASVHRWSIRGTGTSVPASADMTVCSRTMSWAVGSTWPERRPAQHREPAGLSTR